MSRVLFRAVVEGFTVIPAARTRRGSQTEAAVAYRQNQKDLVDLYITWALIQNATERKLGQIMTTFPLPGPLVYSHTVGYANDKWRDDDNVRKALTDALKKASIIKEDNAHVIVGADRTRTRLGAGRNYFVLELREDMGKDLE
jgi:Holliday junction resolvase RusA-like endonuclease